MARPFVVGVIPARWGSTRLPQKMNADIAGKPLIVRTFEAVSKASMLDRVIVATDDKRIADSIEDHGGLAVLTDPELPSGSDRIWAASKFIKADVVVNIQGDEPLMPADVIDRSVSLLLESNFSVTTAATSITYEQLLSPDVVKVVTDKNSRALYFSRSMIPYIRDIESDEEKASYLNNCSSIFKRHIGLYVYKRDALEAFCSWEPTPMERCEKLEQLRLLENGIDIGVADVICDSIGVDTAEDLEHVRKIFSLK
jgi:3-deoxy-manno-octulosonate cytidylyltransferase (CMP-KDO synthetase)